ncbi:hypothetical protein LOZ53_003449 [Ophidiomyces ophidiicola]|nr:hypothetical protein LOZ55_006261 [Ophidiomyces ophidiicola]KAI1983752.1 hypothetical protein LOZ54_004802 [Ophidiomyces ophidiicola]KAI1989883.1 hypothetical protein LOZ53_003449 [Ophidiomyces ophidiicola]KAI2001120.1 hypothetical protein LOZ51_001412 [Ophidiomyces ophidiicola]
MKVATLQFSPTLGDVEGNIKRADAILDEASGRIIEGLDLLVLPEMIFSGYNFSSLRTISPYLEPTAAGRSSAWARSTARHLGCVVCVGYPEICTTQSAHVENQDYIQEGAKRFNSLLIVDDSGNVLLNYQKRFLYYTDNSWALEGENGKGFLFLPGSTQGSSQREYIPAAVGICMDINPYKFIAPYSAYEFATHVLDSGAKIVILSMAWLTLLPAEELFSRAGVPDTDTFQYWIQRFWPLFTKDDWDGEEIIVIIANRTGEEAGLEGKDTARYAGTSCVIGIRRVAKADTHGDEKAKEGGRYFDTEIVLWGRLGRAEEGLCFVDTDKPPKAVFRVIRNPEQ